jgi:hypothetical protein
MHLEVACALVGGDKLDELGVQVRVAEGVVGHEGVVEVARRGAVLESVELGEFGLEGLG